MDAAVVSGVDVIALAAAGVLAGLVGSAGAITSLVSYPALLAVGLPALGASVANNVALVACWPGSALGSRPELRGRVGWLRAWLPIAAVGGAAGAAVLIATPPGTFSRIVPFLVAAGSLALLLEPRLTARRRRGRRHARSWRLALPFGLLVVSFYNGYFGAGAGVMTLVLVLVLAEPHLATANALKNMLIGAGSAASAVVFIASASVQWRAALPLGLGMLVGSRAGPAVARRLPPGLLRWLIAAVGLALAIWLFITPG